MDETQTIGSGCRPVHRINRKSGVLSEIHQYIVELLLAENSNEKSDATACRNEIVNEMKRIEMASRTVRAKLSERNNSIGKW
jgi:Trp operon repressor